MEPEINTRDKVVALIARILIALLFWYSGIGKILVPDLVIATITKAGLPLPYFCYVAAILLEIGAGLCFLIGFKPRIVALVMALYCLLTGLLFHLELANPQQTIQLLKNFAIAGGLLHYLWFGGGVFSANSQRGWPLRASEGLEKGAR